MRRIYFIFCLLFIVIMPTNAFGSTVLDFLYNNKNDLSIPVITYHLITEDSSKWSDYCISPQKLEEDFKLLIANGYKTLSITELSDIYSAINKNPLQGDKIINKYKKSVVLTSDDGYESDFKYIFPLMQKYKIKFNFFVVGGFLDKKSYLTSYEIIEMAANNLVEFGNHSNGLHNLQEATLGEMYNKLDFNEAIINDFISENVILKQLTNKTPLSLSYPYGIFSNNIDAMLQKKGFKLRFTTAGGTANPFTNDTNIGRINRSNSLTSSELITIIKNSN